MKKFLNDPRVLNFLKDHTFRENSASAMNMRNMNANFSKTFMTPCTNQYKIKKKPV